MTTDESTKNVFTIPICSIQPDNQSVWVRIKLQI